MIVRKCNKSYNKQEFQVMCSNIYSTHDFSFKKQLSKWCWSVFASSRKRCDFHLGESAQVSAPVQVPGLRDRLSKRKKGGSMGARPCVIYASIAAAALDMQGDVCQWRACT